MSELLPLCASQMRHLNIIRTLYAACGIDWESPYTLAGRTMHYTSRAGPVEHLF